MERSVPGSGANRHQRVQALLAIAIILAIGFAAGPTLAQTVALVGSKPGAAAGLTARADANRPLTLHLSFRLRNRAALSKLLADLQNPASPQYHHWLNPTAFNSRFGRSPAEVKAVSKWLSAHGLRMLHSSNREMILGATVRQAEETFGTSIAASADGARFSNASEPRIPSGFAEVVGSIEGLDNLRHWSRVASPLPSFASSPATTNAFGPQDLWTFYDETPPMNGAIDGSGGDCIAVIEDSDYLDASVTTFDSMFSIPDGSVARVFSDSSSPGDNIDETEALVDIEWAHATAPGAPISVYIGNSQFQRIDPLTDSLLKAVSDNKCGAITFTFSFCGAAASFYSGTIDPAMAQAASQGQTVFVSSGDWGSAGLVAAGNECVPASSQSVNEVAADPNVIGVGGTQFVPTYNSQNQDVGNVSEAAWANGAGATGGGKSAVFPKPFYQISVTPNDSARDVPDVALGASNVTPGFFWVSANENTPEPICCIGGTSLSAPVWAGISKLIAEIAGERLGNMNPRIYQLGEFGDQSMSGLRDVISGNNTFNGVPGFNATLGYDRTTGWGTVDVQTFEAQFLSSAIPQPPTPTATPTPSSSITFVGAGALADSSAAVSSLSVSLPAGVQAGDTMITQIVVYDAAGADVPTAPNGWTAIVHNDRGKLKRKSGKRLPRGSTIRLPEQASPLCIRGT